MVTAAYPIVTTDSHVNEPREIYPERIPREFRDRYESEFLTEVLGWRKDSAPSGKVPNPKFPDEVNDLKGEANGGAWDLATRLRHQQLDGVSVDLIYPTTALVIPNIEDPAFRFAMARVYNDWAFENFRGASRQMVPAAVVPPQPVDLAVAEVNRVAKMGFKTIFMPSQWPALPYNRQAHGPLWAAIQDSGLPVSFHVGTGRNPRAERGPGGAVINYAMEAQGDGPRLAAYLCASGVLMHFPNLKFAIVESGASWVAWIMNAMDEAYVHHYTSVRDFEQLDLLPSEYFKRQGHACFMFDPGAMNNIPLTGADCLMWGNDYPHREGTWPRSQDEIAVQFAGVSEDDKRKILGGNAIELYNLDIA